MIKILQDKLVIEIDTQSPIEDLAFIKSGLLKALEVVALNDNNGAGCDIGYMTSVFDLLGAMEYSPEQIEKAFGIGHMTISANSEADEPEQAFKAIKEVNQIHMETIKDLEQQVKSLKKQLEAA